MRYGEREFKKLEKRDDKEEWKIEREKMVLFPSITNYTITNLNKKTVNHLKIIHNVFKKVIKKV